MPFVLMKTIMRLIRLINKNRLPLFQNQIQIFLLYKINVVLLAGADELPSARAVGLSSVCLSTRGYPWTDTSQDSEQYGFFLSSRIYAHCPLLIAQTHGHWCRILFLRLRLLSLSLHNWRWGEERRENCHRTADNDLLTYWSLSPPPPAPYFPIVQRSCHFSLFLLLLLLFLLLLLLFFLLGVHLFPRSPAPMFARVLLVENRQSTEFLDTPHHDATNNCLLLFLNNQILIVNIAQFKNEFICPFDLITFP